MKIGVLKKNQYSAVEYYRLAPWAFLARQTGVQVVAIDRRNSDGLELASLDALVCHSPATKEEMGIVLSAHRHGVKLIMDYDDLYWEIDDINPAKKFWGREENQVNAVELMLVASSVTVSTSALAQEFERRFRINVTVIPNAFNDMARSVATKQKTRKKPLVLWRGSNTHEGDIFTHREAFQEFPNLDYLFFGYQPIKLITRYGGHLDVVPFKEGVQHIEFYFDHLLSIAPTYVVAPLEDTVFNRCKSNIVWQEATWAGAVTIAPGYMPEFATLPCLHYNSVEELLSIFRTIDTGAKYVDVLNAARNELITNWLLSDVNHIRVDVLNDVLQLEQAVDAQGEGG